MTCEASEQKCSGACVDTATDKNNCGACGAACAATDVCSQGKCQLSCSAPETRCESGDAGGDAGDAGKTGPYCANLQTSATSCGACGTSCNGSTETCSAGACVCKTGLVSCSSACIDPLTDNAHCGATTDCAGANSGTACTAFQACNAGACKAKPLAGAGTSVSPYTNGTGYASCKAYKTEYAAAAADGFYTVNPAGTPFDVYCDQTQNGGGWTRCLEFVNTAAEDVVGNAWFDRCVEYAEAAWQTGDVMVDLRDTARAIKYSSTGQKTVSWTNDKITSTVGSGGQYLADSHDRLVTLANTDRLMISGRASGNSGCGGSMGNGYGIVIYPAAPSYIYNPKVFVMPYQQVVGSSGPRSFGPWSQDREIAWNNGNSFNSCSSFGYGGDPSVPFLGSFELFVR